MKPAEIDASPRHAEQTAFPAFQTPPTIRVLREFVKHEGDTQNVSPFARRSTFSAAPSSGPRAA
jgi:hypothetical protein